MEQASLAQAAASKLQQRLISLWIKHAWPHLLGRRASWLVARLRKSRPVRAHSWWGSAASWLLDTSRLDSCVRRPRLAGRERSWLLPAGGAAQGVISATWAALKPTKCRRCIY